jgi:hypothetical protein
MLSIREAAQESFDSKDLFKGSSNQLETMGQTIPHLVNPNNDVM